ncbi:hypothetical protein ESOMN_v1c04800 [Williamsoniiplasma somnilux]|uniref:Uncharacterized protein n=1 Tax=Williamsoniiplasma somnilux TaxID=215578 RepID=A0A2K8NYE9_9MOLU|nr:hypothetical protein [Williamsoniiplasma somnilux]ATZ18862.1 hypothetical protein ESOMN_v1c04800 [Williamsoniiplasma somnilux]
MEKQQKTNNKKEVLKKAKINKVKIGLICAVVAIIVAFFLIKIVNAIVNKWSILEAFKTIGITPPTNLNLSNIIDYIANIILLIVLPILVLTWIVLVIKFKQKITLKQAQASENTNINPDVLEIENPDADIYPYQEEDKTFFEEINDESDNELTFLQQRAKSDGSILIKENLSELVKNAYKIKNYAILNNIDVEDVVLDEMTKKELILFMKKIGDKLKKVEYQKLNFQDLSAKETSEIIKNNDDVQFNKKKPAKNVDNVNKAEINKKKPAKNVDKANEVKINKKKPIVRKKKVSKKLPKKIELKED